MLSLKAIHQFSYIYAVSINAVLLYIADFKDITLKNVQIGLMMYCINNSISVICIDSNFKFKLLTSFPIDKEKTNEIIEYIKRERRQKFIDYYGISTLETPKERVVIVPKISL